MAIIRTLSLEGYVAREARNGYACALIAPDVNDEQMEVVTQNVNDVNLPYEESIRVNVQSGLLVGKKWKGYGLLPQNTYALDQSDVYNVWTREQVKDWLNSL